MTRPLSPVRAILATLLVFAILEATAAVWHLLLFRAFYVAETAVMDRPFDEYVVPWLMGTNLARAIALVSLFAWALRSGPISYARGTRLGLMVGTVCGLATAEYFGVWRFRSVAWPLVEGLWLIAQGATVGAGATWALSVRRRGTVE